nr:PREDICTED: scavenger receptor class F member 1 isoform X1 [Latimeria chalumnae]|eukprot:XP_006006161.1 PREDICTED: scavenger receptor class F member 1 isoform X1 [Latimeria chalumnae]
MVWFLICLACLFGFWTDSTEDLDPKGLNVCKSQSFSVSPSLICCPGWKQKGHNCSVPLCEGPETCAADEICIKPGLCRCKPGFYGADCKSRCPNQYWGPDCKQFCICHPHGKCDAVSGRCTCNANRWGQSCEHKCLCMPHGRCDPATGRCHCEAGWWSQTCRNKCLCYPSNSHCNPQTGICNCMQGFWGNRCSFRCSCNGSPCEQTKGKCKCKEKWWGPSCNNSCKCFHGKCNATSGLCTCDPGYHGDRCSLVCPAGYHGDRCRFKCGQCKQSQTCNPVDGSCLICDLGWNGTRCDQPCPLGYHGENCTGICPYCRNREECSPKTGMCVNCDPGWTGPRCDNPCPLGKFGDQCQSICSPCCHGKCDHVTGDCLCDPGYWGDSCDTICLDGSFGKNCSLSCECGVGSCDHISGICQFRSGKHGVLVAGILIGVLFLLLLLCGVCCCCGAGQPDAKDRVAVGDGTPLARMKHHVQGVLANFSSIISCFPFRNSKLPRITVSHHDVDITFNHSFIEPSSAGWASESSFESDENGPVYCVPPKEDALEVTGGEFRELSSKCNIFLDASAFNGEDVSQLFPIPRTSSIAKAKRPSVSFAEGTKFAPEEHWGSVAEAPNLSWKPKLPWNLPKLYTIQSHPTPGEENQLDTAPYEYAEIVETRQETEALANNGTPRSTPGGRQRTMSNTKKGTQSSENMEPKVKSSEAAGSKQKISTVYVTVGKAEGLLNSTESSEGKVNRPVQSVLKRFGSFHKSKGNSKEESKCRSRVESISKPPKRALQAQEKSSRNPSLEQDNISLRSSQRPNMGASKHCRKPSTVSTVIAKFQDASNMVPVKKALIPTSSILRKIVAKAEGLEKESEVEENSETEPAEERSKEEKDMEMGENPGGGPPEDPQQTTEGHPEESSQEVEEDPHQMESSISEQELKYENVTNSFS